MQGTAYCDNSLFSTQSEISSTQHNLESKTLSIIGDDPQSPVRCIFPQAKRLSLMALSPRRKEVGSAEAAGTALLGRAGCVPLHWTGIPLHCAGPGSTGPGRIPTTVTPQLYATLNIAIRIVILASSTHQVGGRRPACRRR